MNSLVKGGCNPREDTIWIAASLWRFWGRSQVSFWWHYVNAEDAVSEVHFLKKIRIRSFLRILAVTWGDLVPIDGFVVYSEGKREWEPSPSLNASTEFWNSSIITNFPSVFAKSRHQLNYIYFVITNKVWTYLFA